MSPEFRCYLVKKKKKKKLKMTRVSISALVSLLQDQKSVIERVRQDTVSICENRSLQSGLSADADRQVSSENYSIFDSNIGDEIFSFDDEIVNSFAYRNALKRLASKTKATQQNAKPDEHHILDEPLIDLGGLSEVHNGPSIKSTVTSNHPCLIPSKPFTHTAHLSDTITEDLKSLLPNSVASLSRQRNERHAHFASPLCDGESPNDTSANHSDKKRDVKRGIGQRVRAREYRERNVLDKPAFAAPRSTSVTADDHDKDTTLSMAKRGETFGAGCPDVTHSSILMKELPSLQRDEKQRAEPVVEQAAREDSYIASPSSRVLRVNGNTSAYFINAARVDHGSALDEAKVLRDYAATRRRRRIERAPGAMPSSPPTFGPKSRDDGTHGDQHGHESRTKASEDEGIFCDRLHVEHSYTGHETDEYDKRSKEAVTNTEAKPARETKRRHRRKDPIAERLIVTLLDATALLNHEREDSSSNRDTRPGLPRQKRRRRRILDKSQNPGNDAGLIDNSESKGGDGVVSNPSIDAKPRLLETVENAIRRLIIPEPEVLKQRMQEQRKKRGSQRPEPSHRDLQATPGTSADSSHKRYDQNGKDIEGRCMASRFSG